jgi:hypothetical protein
MKIPLPTKDHAGGQPHRAAYWWWLRALVVRLIVGFALYIGTSSGGSGGTPGA